MPGKRYLNQSEASRVYACTTNTVNKAIAPGKQLHPAVVKRDGMKLIDMQHPAAKAYRASHRVDVAKADAAARDVSNELPEKIRECWDLSLGEIFTRYGSLGAFKDVLTATDKIEAIQARRVDSDRKAGDLISRVYVKRHVMGLVEQVFQRLLTDMPVRLAMEIHGICSTGATMEDVQQRLHDGVSRELKTLKRDARSKVKRHASE